MLDSKMRDKHWGFGKRLKKVFKMTAANKQYGMLK